MADDYYLARGTLSKSALLVDAYRVINFTKQSDTPTGWGWRIATNDEVVPYVERPMSLSSRFGGQGKSISLIRFAILSPKMRDYLDSNVFLGEETTDVTVQLRNRDSDAFDWLVYNGKLHKPDRTNITWGLHGNGRFEVDVPFQLTRLTLAAGQGAYSDGYSDGYAN